jgi:hypothetical protein
MKQLSVVCYCFVIIKAPSTDNSHQEAHRTSWRMAIASYEDRSDPESLRIEITETDHPIVGRKRESSTTCVALQKTFHCDKDKLTPTLVGTLSFSQNISNCKFFCLWSFIFCTILMLSNHIYHFK